MGVQRSKPVSGGAGAPSLIYIWAAIFRPWVLATAAKAVGSTLLVVFKSRCVKISFCFGLWRCDREVQDASDSEEPPADQPALPARDQP